MKISQIYVLYYLPRLSVETGFWARKGDAVLNNTKLRGLRRIHNFIQQTGPYGISSLRIAFSIIYTQSCRNQGGGRGGLLPIPEFGTSVNNIPTSAGVWGQIMPTTILFAPPPTQGFENLTTALLAFLPRIQILEQ